MKQYLFIFSIGPVQSFIAQARKTQDLYAGSSILSELTKAAIRAVGKEKIIFPFVQDLNTIKSLPNRFVAKFETDNPTELKSKGDDIEKVVLNAWWELAKKHTKEYASLSFLEKHCKSQIENHLDINWLFYPIGDDYALAYQEAESLLGSVKNVRVFKQNAEKGRKCSIDGERNVKFYRLTDDDRNDVRKSKLFLDTDDEVKIFEERNAPPLSILTYGEGLSAVSFVKRCYRENNEKEEFESTAEIALMQNESEIKSDKILSLLKCYKQLFAKRQLAEACIKLFSENQINRIDFSDDDIDRWNTDFDYQYLYEENITEKNFPNPLQRRLVKDVFPKLQPYFKSKYYAVLTFDGDKMGEIMGGGFLEDKNILEYYQKRVSQLLSEFAQKPAVLEAPQGKTVYAGGDDYLGFVNLDNLFDVMQNLRDNFDKYVNHPLKKEFRKELKDEFEFTFSAGVAIAHYKTPLSIVLKKAKEMEKRAKDDTGRNAFGLAVLKHSGESHEACLKWENMYLIQDLWKGLSDKNFSGKFITSLQREFGFFKKDVENEKIDFFKDLSHGRKILRSEIGRLVKRAKSNEVQAKSIETFATTVFDIFDNEGNKDFNNFSEMLNIVEFMKRKNNNDNDN